MRFLLVPLLLTLAIPAFAQKAKSVEKEGAWDVVTLESGGKGGFEVPMAC